MIDCMTARDALPDLVHGGPVPFVVGAHLAGCAECRREVRLLEEVCQVLAAAPAVRVDRIVAALPPPPPRRRVESGGRPWWRAVALAAGLLLAVGLWGGGAATAPERISDGAAALLVGEPSPVEREVLALLGP